MIQEHEIRDAAYFKWLRIGSPILNEEQQRILWLEAEEDLLRERRMPYRILLQNETLEVRKYFPQKRVIVAAGREYYIQFPYLIFAGRFHESGSYLYVGFGKKDDETVYFPSLPNMCPQTYGICLGRSGGHFQQDKKKDLDNLIELFWITEFDAWSLGWTIAHRALQQNFQGRLNDWKKLNLQEVLDHVTYMPRSFDFFIERISKHHTDYEMRVAISNYNGCDPVEIKKEPPPEDNDNLAPLFKRQAEAKFCVEEAPQLELKKMWEDDVPAVNFDFNGDENPFDIYNI